MEQEGKQNREKYRFDIIAVAALALSIIGGAFSLAGFFIARHEDVEKRSVTEIDRLYDSQFIASLAKIVGKETAFIDAGKFNNDPVKRFGEFWQEAGDTDADMLQISSRIKSVSQCLFARNCDRDEVFSRFPESTYQALFFLRDFIFADPQVVEGVEKGNVDGWWFGYDVYDLLSDYCAWTKQKVGGMNLWSPKYELLMRPGQPLPDPCFPPRTDRNQP
jgi:hypothetical protein